MVLNYWSDVARRFFINTHTYLNIEKKNEIYLGYEIKCSNIKMIAYQLHENILEAAEHKACKLF